MDSILLQKQVRDNAKDLQDFCKELKEWGDEIKTKDESLKRSQNNQSEAPLPKNKISKISEISKDKNKKEVNVKQSKQIKGCDYAAWDKFDADAYCVKLDNDSIEEHSSTESELSDEVDESTMDLANSEKEKGNVFVKKQQWNQAIDCYTRAIECYAYDPIYYANRALCYLKKEKYQYAESDCTTALQLDKTYVKAYQRRAAARENLNQFCEAQSDLLRVLELEPKNKESRTVLKRVEKKLENTKQEKVEVEEPQRPVSKFTLSRKKHKNSGAELQLQEGVKKEVPAISEHIIERVAPINLTAIDKRESSISYENKIEPQIEVESSEKVISTEELPESLLSGPNTSDITLFNSVYKLPKNRSKKALKRIEIIDVDLKTEKNYLPSKITLRNQEDILIKTVAENKTNTCNKEVEIYDSEKGDHLNILSSNTAVQFKNQEDVVIKTGTENEANTCNKKVEIYDSEKCDHLNILSSKTVQFKNREDILIKTVAENETNTYNKNVDTFDHLNVLSPKTAVQFYNNWKNISDNKEWKKLYLQKINANDLSMIFKESLESKVFSEIIEVFNDSCEENQIPVYEYLLGLSNVKRFATIIMFMSSKDKKNLSNIIDHLKQDNKYTAMDIDKLINLYEL